VTATAVPPSSFAARSNEQTTHHMGVFAAGLMLQSWRHCCFARASSADSAHLHIEADPAHCRDHVRCPGTAHCDILKVLQHIHLLEETVANMISDGWQGKPKECQTQMQGASCASPAS
jgi:hypothetical protein